ncbi:LysM peptidoglycan-binding domain-containing protein [Saccharopolyspora cebuensis]|uniref:LysM peptidoglycan-binding domain-containing protein n=1 Tax=Saccharopolyspora cebuensis TaxID=418759 RepID=A0ABV4CPT6_9PSEU
MTTLRRLAAALGLLTLLLALPTLLALATQAFPWPHLTPPPVSSGALGELVWADVQAWAERTYHELRLGLGPDGLLLATCLLTGWTLWAVALSWIAADLAAALRHGTHRLREHRPAGVRGWITGLVTGAVLLGTATPSLATMHPDPVAGSAPRHPGGPQRTPEAPPAAPEAGGHPTPSPPASLHTQPGDTLWDLAETHLGDGTRWPEITDLNPHLPTDPQDLGPGAPLWLPTTEPAPLRHDTRWVTVADGDTLSGLARQHLGNPERWKEIFDLNHGRTQPDHRALQRPEHLLPGWQLALPSATATEPAKTPVPPQHPTRLPPEPPTPAPTTHPDSGLAPYDGPPDAPAELAVPGAIVGLAAAGTLAAALGYRYRLRRTRRPHPDPAPNVYPLLISPPSAADRDTIPSEHLDDELTHESRNFAAHAGTRDLDDPAEDTSSTGAAPHHPEPPRLSTDDDTDGLSAGADLEIVQTTVTPAPPPATAPEPVPSTPEPGQHTETPLRITMFGPPRLYCRPEPGSDEQEITGTVQPRQRELLTFLALHPAGVRREEFVEALWGEAAVNTNALNTALSRLRRTLSALGRPLNDVVVAEHGHYRLHPELVEVDYWDFTTALTTRRAATTDDDRFGADDRIIAAYQGSLAAGIDSAWTEPLREHARRAFLDAVAAHVRTLHQQHPQHTLGLLEHARDLDPLHEPLYRDIMRLQHDLGHTDAIPRTFMLLRNQLADIAARPSPATVALAERLQRGAT